MVNLGPQPRDFLLNARALSVQRGGRALFTDLSFTLAAGAVLQIAGPNGAGKSTLLRALAGLTAPDAGEVRVSGLPEGMPAAQGLHYAGHREGLREALSARENLAFLAALLGGDAALIPEALRQLGALRLIDLPVRVLSAGQRRRVALARLLIAQRPLWLLDEPLAALDVQGQQQIEALIGAHAAAGGVVVLATHQPLALPVQVLDLGAKNLELKASFAGISGMQAKVTPKITPMGSAPHPAGGSA